MGRIPRVIITAHDGTALGDLDPTQLIALVAIGEVNGENALSVTTTQELTKGDRLLWRDGRGYWHEYVVNGGESPHDMPDGPVHTYYCPWSVQYDLEGTYVTGMPGTGGTPATATQALTAALEGTARWTVGTVGVTSTGSASFWRMSGWEAMQKLVEVWGGEVSTTITVSTTGVVGRAVNLLLHVGDSSPSRRFDYGHDMRGITRTLEDQLWTARVMPLGAGEETESGGYGRKITIDSVNGGVPYLENANAVPLTRVPDGNGGWEVPVQVVENSDCETPADLKAWAQAHLEDWTTPKVSYQADVVQLARAGMDALGVSLGDEVVAVDKTFGATPLRIQGRALRIEEDLIDPTATVLTVSNLRGSLASTLSSLARATSDVYRMVEGMSANQSSVEWVSNLIARINDEANATGGYTYITEGQGTRTYDVAVSDPLVGSEASMVVEIKGGNIRIANTKDSQGNWEWKTLIQSGYVNSEVIRAMGSGSGGIAEVTSTGFRTYLGQALITSFLADGVRFYDGLGTAAANILAQFTTSGAQIGKLSAMHLNANSGGVYIEGPDNTLISMDNSLGLLDGSRGGVIRFNPDVVGASTEIEGGAFSGYAAISLSANRISGQQGYGPSLNLLSDASNDFNYALLQTSDVSGRRSNLWVESTSIELRSGATSSDPLGKRFWLDSDGANLNTTTYIYDHSLITTTSSIDYDTTLSDDTGGAGVYFREADGSTDNIGYVRSFGRSGSDRLRGVQIGGHNIAAGSDIWNFLYLLTDKDGNRVVQVSERAPWLTALGLDTVGTLVTESPSAVNVATSSWATLGSITLSAGVWDISISSTFASNSTGRRAIYFGTSSTGSDITVGQMGSSIMAPATGDKTKYSNHHIGNLTSNTTYYCRAWQNSGSTLSCQCYLRAVRIK